MAKLREVMTCPICSRQFLIENRNQKYCKDCKGQAKLQYNREYYKNNKDYWSKRRYRQVIEKYGG